MPPHASLRRKHEFKCIHLFRSFLVDLFEAVELSLWSFVWRKDESSKQCLGPRYSKLGVPQASACRVPLSPGFDRRVVRSSGIPYWLMRLVRSSRAQSLPVRKTVLQFQPVNNVVAQRFCFCAFPSDIRSESLHRRALDALFSECMLGLGAVDPESQPANGYDKFPRRSPSLHRLAASCMHVHVGLIDAVIW
jgi:hypothetical protein